MNKRLADSRPGRQYEAFLFAPLGEDRNGAPLALASILGRMSLDPWHEAASFAAMSADVAATKLASLIESVPNQSLTPPESATLAARLIKLLPSRPQQANPEPDAAPDAEASEDRRRIGYVVGFCLFCILLAGVLFG